MQFIIFEGTSEEGDQQTGGPDLRCDADLTSVAHEDVLWIVTRSALDRRSPAVCGRLVAERIEADEDPATASPHAGRAYRLIIDQGRSERCAPFECAMVKSWGIWRQPFEGVRKLTDEQGKALETEWGKSSRAKRGLGPG